MLQVHQDRCKDNLDQCSLVEIIQNTQPRKLERRQHWRYLEFINGGPVSLSLECFFYRRIAAGLILWYISDQSRSKSIKWCCSSDLRGTCLWASHPICVTYDLLISVTCSYQNHGWLFFQICHYVGTVHGTWLDPNIGDLRLAQTHLRILIGLNDSFSFQGLMPDIQAIHISVMKLAPFGCSKRDGKVTEEISLSDRRH